MNPVLDDNIKITLLNAKNAEKTLDHEWSPSVPEPIPGSGSGWEIRKQIFI